MKLQALLGLLISVAASQCAWSAEPPKKDPGPPEWPFHLETHNSSKWDVNLTRKHGPFSGVVYYAIPPSDPCQTILSSELYAETQKGRVNSVIVLDAGPYKKPLYKLALNAKAPFTVIAHVVVQFHDTDLKEGPPPKPAKPILPAHRPEYLADGWPNAHAREWFHQWMTTHKLIRGENEEPDVFAYRVLEFLQIHFRYVIPDNVPEWKAAVKKDPLMGDWHYTIRKQSGECWRLSDTYCRVMRINGIPARLVSGNFVEEKGGHHLRSIIYLQGAGWIPVEATAAISSQRKPPLPFFGSWGGTYLSGNSNVDFVLEGPKGKTEIGTLDCLAFGSADGNWDYPTPEFTVKRISPPSAKTAKN